MQLKFTSICIIKNYNNKLFYNYFIYKDLVPQVWQIIDFKPILTTL
jgi:hypothetical protein